jgi:hypothetical protein
VAVPAPHYHLHFIVSATTRAAHLTVVLDLISLPNLSLSSASLYVGVH